MFSSALSPTRTPSKSVNVEKLMSLQKSAKHLTVDDILSVAAEASAMKRQQAKFTANLENVEPNTARTLPRRLFDISECSKSAAGFYVSPEKAATKSSDLQDDNQHDKDSDSESESDAETEIDANKQAQKHFAEIITIVNNKANRQVNHRHAHRDEIRNGADSLVDSDGGSSDDDLMQSDYTETGDFSDTAEVLSGGVSGLKEQVVRHILSVLNTGTHDEILALHGIGQVRALRIFTVRNAGESFASLQDFAEAVGMNEYTLTMFMKANAAHIMV